MKNHLNLVKRILSSNGKSQHTVIYTDEFKIQANVGAGLAYLSERKSDEKS